MIFNMQQSNKNVSDESKEILDLINAGKNITIVRRKLGKSIRFIYDPEDEILLLNTALLGNL